MAITEQERAALALSLVETIDTAIDAAGCTTVQDVHDLLSGMMIGAKEHM